MTAIQIVNVGHSTAMLPLAVGIAVHLIACRVWKSALWWSGMFLAGLTSVALSKIMFLAWGVGVSNLAFQALSGHAFRVAAVIPTFFFVILKPISTSLAKQGVVTGIISSLVIDMLLVFLKFHSFSEVVASSLLGFATCLGFILISRDSAFPRISSWSAAWAMLAIFSLLLLRPWSYNYRLVDFAIYLSGG